MVSSVPGLYPVHTSSTSTVVIIKNVSRHCHMSQGWVWGWRGEATLSLVENHRASMYFIPSLLDYKDLEGRDPV